MVAVPDESMGEEVGAAVVLKDGRDVSAKELPKGPTSATAAISKPTCAGA